MTMKIRGRFNDSKQAQIDQLTAYVQMMGLDGKDLMAIGGKMRREQRNAQIEQNHRMIQSMELHAVRGYALCPDKFKLKTALGDYNFTRRYDYVWRVYSVRTRQTRNHHSDRWQHTLGKRTSYDKLQQNVVLMDVITGALKLDF